MTWELLVGRWEDVRKEARPEPEMRIGFRDSEAIVLILYFLKGGNEDSTVFPKAFVLPVFNLIKNLGCMYVVFPFVGAGDYRLLILYPGLSHRREPGF